MFAVADLHSDAAYGDSDDERSVGPDSSRRSSEEAVMPLLTGAPRSSPTTPLAATSFSFPEIATREVAAHCQALWAGPNDSVALAFTIAWSDSLLAMEEERYWRVTAALLTDPAPAPEVSLAPVRPLPHPPTDGLGPRRTRELLQLPRISIFAAGHAPGSPWTTGITSAFPTPTPLPGPRPPSARPGFRARARPHPLTLTVLAPNSPVPSPTNDILTARPPHRRRRHSTAPRLTVRRDNREEDDEGMEPPAPRHIFHAHKPLVLGHSPLRPPQGPATRAISALRAQQQSPIPNRETTYTRRPSAVAAPPLHME